MERIKNFFKDESGASAVEYGLLVSLIAVAIIVTVTALGGKLSDVFYGLSTSRVGEGHTVQDDPRARPGMTRQEIIDRLGWFKELGVTISAVPIPMLKCVEDYFDYTQWVAEEIMPAVK